MWVPEIWGPYGCTGLDTDLGMRETDAFGGEIRAREIHREMRWRESRERCIGGEGAGTECLGRKKIKNKHEIFTDGPSPTT